MAKERRIQQTDPKQPFEGHFEEIYSEHFEPLYLYARSITRSDDLAKDVVSEVFFNLWQFKSDLSKISEIRAYLFRSVKNQVIRTLSYDPRKFDRIDTENYNKRIERVNPEEVLLEKELVKIIGNTVKALPDSCKLIFEMAKNKHMTVAQIAEELGISQSTVKTQITRAVTAIKKSIEEQYDDVTWQSWAYTLLPPTIAATTLLQL